MNACVVMGDDDADVQTRMDPGVRAGACVDIPELSPAPGT